MGELLGVEEGGEQHLAGEVELPGDGDLAELVVAPVVVMMAELSVVELSVMSVSPCACVGWT